MIECKDSMVVYRRLEIGQGIAQEENHCRVIYNDFFFKLRFVNEGKSVRRHNEFKPGWDGAHRNRRARIWTVAVAVLALSHFIKSFKNHPN